MTKYVKLLWSFGLLFVLTIGSINCKPCEIIYTGEAGCECSRNIPYTVNIPLQEPAPYLGPHRDYEYRVDSPVSKTKYSYSFDIEVEQPLTTPSPPPVVPKLNLWAKIDRIAMPKPDLQCRPKCTCGRCGIVSHQPSYSRYVIISHPNSLNTQNTAVVRAKRDLTAIQKDGGKRSRLEKSKNRKNLTSSTSAAASKRSSRLQWSDIIASPSSDDILPPQQSKNLNGNVKPKIIKRYIKGEYDVLKKLANNLDLTLPEITQYMPETLRSTFRRGKCQFGCTAPDVPDTFESEANSNDASDDQQNCAQVNEENAIFRNYAKRHIGKLVDGMSEPPQADMAYNPLQWALLAQQHTRSQVNQPGYDRGQGPAMLYRQEPEPELNVGQLPHRLKQQQFVDDRFGSNNDGNFRLNTGLMATQANDDYDTQHRSDSGDLSADFRYQQHDDPALINLILNIICGHPEFIKASDHGPDSLVSPAQREETIELLGKLIRGRLQSWLGNANNHYKVNEYVDSEYRRQPPAPSRDEREFISVFGAVDNRGFYDESSVATHRHDDAK